MSILNSIHDYKHLPRPTASQTSSFVGSAKYALGETIYNVDTQKLLLVAGIAATLGIGSFAIYYGKKKRALLAEAEKRRTSRVSFQTPENAMKDVMHKENPDEQAELPMDSIPNCDKAFEVEEVLPEPDEAVLEDKLVLKQCPRGRKTPCIAPFPLKLETFLRVHGIKYELDFNGHEPKIYGSPWIKFNSEDITDSQNVVQFLIDTYGIQVERDLTDQQRTLTTAYTSLLENHLYWGIALWRWVYDGARTLKEIQLLPRKIQELIPDVCRTVAQAAWFHGIGQMSPAEVKKAVLKDLAALSEFLGDKKYFLNTEVPTELDCTAFGMLAQFLWNMKGPFHDAILNSHANLREFCWRMRQTYWPDWEDCLNNTDFYSNEEYPVAESKNYNLNSVRQESMDY